MSKQLKSLPTNTKELIEIGTQIAYEGKSGVVDAEHKSFCGPVTKMELLDCGNVRMHVKTNNKIELAYAQLDLIHGLILPIFGTFTIKILRANATQKEMFA